MGISGNVLNGIKSFLNDKLRRVKLGQTFSSFAEINSGVPQESVLGPLLFVLFINDIVCANSQGNTLKLFADDVNSYVTGIGNECKARFYSSVTEILEWAKTWQLPVNFKKSSFGLISNDVISNDVINGEVVGGDDLVTFNNEIISKIDEVKNLGVLFNFKLNFSSHISNVISKAKHRIFLLKKCITSGDAVNLIKGFRVYVLPILDYNSQIWSPYKLGDISKIESVQRTFLKYLRGYEGLDYNKRLEKAQL